MRVRLLAPPPTCLPSPRRRQVIDRSGTQDGGKDWEVLFALGIIVVSMLLYTFIVANVHPPQPAPTTP